MRRYILFFLLIAFPYTAWASPSNSMSIKPTATAGTTIFSSDENTRNNEISSKYNAHTHTDISQVGNTLNVGDGNSGNKVIQANNTDLNKPNITFDDTNDVWIISQDGTTTQTIVVVSGTQNTKNTLPQSPSDNQHMQYDSATGLWLASNEVDINSGTIDGVTIGASSAPTVTNLGTVTTADINGGTIDGTTIGVSSATTGAFTTVTGNSAHFNETSAPTTAASQGALYTKDTSGQPELFYREESNGDEVQMTNGGFLDSQIRHISTTTVTTSTNSGDITLSENKFYMIYLELQDKSSTTSSLGLRFNSVSAAGKYQVGSNSTEIILTDTLQADSVTTGQLFIGTKELGSGGQTMTASVWGTLFSLENASGVWERQDVSGIYVDTPNVSNFEIFSITSDNFSGDVIVYEVNIP